MIDLEPPYVATVAGVPVPLAWVEVRLAELRRGRLGRQLPPAGGEVERLRRWIVQEIVDRVVERHEARAAGLLAHDPSDLANGPARLPADVAARLFERVTAGVTVAEDALLAYYERNADLYERREARDLRYAIARSASAAREALESPGGAQPRTPSPTSAVRHGVLEGVRRGELSGPIEEAVFAARVGAVVGPFPYADGWMAGRVEAVAPASRSSFEEVRPMIEADLRSAARTRAYAEWLAARRAELVVVEAAYEHPGHPIHGLPAHRHG